MAPHRGDGPGWVVGGAWGSRVRCLGEMDLGGEGEEWA